MKASCYPDDSKVTWHTHLMMVMQHCGVNLLVILHSISNLKVHSRSVDPRKLCGVRVAINYTPLSMAYYTYESTANFILRVYSGYNYAHQKNSAAKRGVANFEFEPVIRKLWQLF